MTIEETKQVCEFELLAGGRLPEMQTKGAAGFDLYCPQNTIIKQGRNLVPLRFRMRFAFHLLSIIKARSGFEVKGFEGFPMGAMQFDGTLQGEAKRYDADVLEGLVDSDYRGEVNVIVKSYGKDPFIIAAGTRIAQMIFVEIAHPTTIQVETLPDNGRGGFGSTGTK